MKKDIKRLTVQDIHSMSYTDFIVLLRETNRCPGGKDTIYRISSFIDINEKSRILDIGSNTGFTSFEFAHISRAHIYGIDISKVCVNEANRLLNEDIDDVRARVSFSVGSAYEIPFENESFDIVMAGGATGFMNNKDAAINEYRRVLKQWGFLVMTPLVYIKTPPENILNEVGAIIGTKIKPYTPSMWIEAVQKISPFFELYINQDLKIHERTYEEIEEYIQYFLRKEHLISLISNVREAIKERWSHNLHVFNENHKYLGYSILIFRKRLYSEEPELFKVSN